MKKTINATATEKQLRYGKAISKVLNIPLPINQTVQDYATFIANNEEAFRQARDSTPPKKAKCQTDKPPVPVKKPDTKSLGLPQVEARLRLETIKNHPQEMPILNKDTLVKFAKKFMEDFAEESILVFNVTPDCVPINFCRVSIGTINQSLTSGREIFKAAILSNAAGVIIVHNHLGMHAHPSEQDIEITNVMRQAGQILGIPLIDHLIIAGEETYSFCEHNLMMFMRAS